MKNYNVTVQVEQNSSKNITSFIFDKNESENAGDISASYSGTITGSAINIDIPDNETITSLIPSVYVSPEASLTAAPSVADFSTAQSYTVQAEDGTTQMYTATVTLVTPSGPSWKPAGGNISVTTDTTATRQIMKIMTDNRVAVTFQENNAAYNPGNPSTIVYDGSAWSYLGSRGYPPLALTTDYAMTINNSNQVFTLFQLSTAGDISSARYLGASWGSTGTVASGNAATTIPGADAADNGDIYAVYKDPVNAPLNQVKVSRFDGISWSPLSYTGLSLSSAVDTNKNVFKIAVDGNTPYIAFFDDSNILQLRMYNGATWDDAGSVDFSSVSFFPIDLIEKNGVLYCLAADGGDLVVRKYNSIFKQLERNR